MHACVEEEARLGACKDTIKALFKQTFNFRYYRSWPRKDDPTGIKILKLGGLWERCMIQNFEPQRRELCPQLWMWQATLALKCFHFRLQLNLVQQVRNSLKMRTGALKDLAAGRPNAQVLPAFAIVV